MGARSTMASPLANIEGTCREIGRDPATIGITALIGLWFPDLQAEKPSFFDTLLSGTVWVAHAEWVGQQGASAVLPQIRDRLQGMWGGPAPVPLRCLRSCATPRSCCVPVPAQPLHADS